MNELSDYLDEAQTCLTNILIDVDENNVTNETRKEMMKLERWIRDSKDILVDNLCK